MVADLRKMQENQGVSENRIDKYGFTKEQVKECLRRPRRKAQEEQERVPKRRGRPAKQIPTTLSSLEKEVKQLRMENELLRDFLKAAERR